MAESMVVADNVELVANNIQNKVGATLLGTRAMAEDTTKEVSETSIGVLDQIKTFQEATVQKVHAVWEILKSQLDLQKDAERRARENEKELALERGGAGGGAGTLTGLKGAVDDAGEGFGSRLKDQLLGAGTALFTMAGLKSFAGKIFKAGLFLMLADLAGDALIEHFDVDDPAVKEQIKLGLPTAAVLFGLLKFRTAIMAIIPAMVAMALWSLTDFITGDKVAAEYNGFDWGKVALTGPALLLTAKMFGLLGTAAGGALTIGGLIVGWPVVIAASLAIALAAGMGYLTSKVGQTQQLMLDHLEDIHKLTQDEFNRRLVEEKSKFLQRLSPALYKWFGGDTTMLQEVEGATEAMADKAESKEGKVSKKEVDDTLATGDKLLMSMASAEFKEEAMYDEHKLDYIREIATNLLRTAASGKVSQEDADAMTLQAKSMFDQVEVLAAEIYQEKGKDAPKHIRKIALKEDYKGMSIDPLERDREHKLKMADLENIKSAHEAEIARLDALKEDSPDEYGKEEKAKHKVAVNALSGIESEIRQLRHNRIFSDEDKLTIDKLYQIISPELGSQLLEEGLKDKKVNLKDINKLIQEKSESKFKDQMHWSQKVSNVKADTIAVGIHNKGVKIDNTDFRYN